MEGQNWNFWDWFKWEGNERFQMCFGLFVYIHICNTPLFDFSLKKRTKTSLFDLSFSGASGKGPLLTRKRNSWDSFYELSFPDGLDFLFGWRR